MLNDNNLLLCAQCAISFKSRHWSELKRLIPDTLEIRLNFGRKYNTVHHNLQRSSSPSRSMTSRVTARSMASTLVTSSAPATSTLPARPSMLLVAKRRRARRLSPSRTCTLSSSWPRSPRTPVASTISLRSWNCLTRTKTRPSSAKISSGCWPILVSP